jgi:exodeoxyribonuclease X
MNFIRCIDIESTGDNSEKDQIIEAGWYDIYPDGTLSAPYGFLVKPTVPISIESRAVHHITDEDLAGAISQEEARQRILENNPVAYVAHNAKFEASFMPWVEAQWLCTYKCALRLWPNAPRHTNQVLRYWLGLDAEPGFDSAAAMPPHRALPDAYTTAHIFARMLKAEGENRLKRLLQWSREPGMLPKITFGKHKGSQWSDVPVDYLRWLVDKSEMDEDVKYTAMQELVRREFGT